MVQRKISTSRGYAWLYLASLTDRHSDIPKANAAVTGLYVARQKLETCEAACWFKKYAIAIALSTYIERPMFKHSW